MHRILAIDDDKGVVEILERFLVSKGFEVKKAYDGQQALSILQQDVPDLIILDEEMPGMDGVAFVKKMRELEMDIPVIMLTGTNGEVLFADTNKTTKEHMFYKPVHLAELLKTINKVLEIQSSPDHEEG